VVEAVLSPDAVPEPGHDPEERGVDEGEAGAAVASGVTREHRQQHQDPHLEEHGAPCPAALTAMELEVERPVDPRSPNHAEDDGELGGVPGRDVFGEMVGGLADDSHVDQVVEELEEADGPIRDGLAVRPRWRQSHCRRRPDVGSPSVTAPT
jgi:hypothetical protein